jgi:hypothetical protein
MSAWMCNDDHLSVLTDALHLFNIVPDGQTKEQTFAALHLENERSLAYRYGDPISDTHEGYRRPPEVRPEDIYTLSFSYKYQSCEHPGWYVSDVYAWIKTLQAKHEELWNVDADEAWDRCHSIKPEGMWSMDPVPY